MKHQIIVLFYLLFTVIKCWVNDEGIQNTCEYGCQTCLKGEVIEQNKCQQCQEGYTLDQKDSYCSYSKCDRNLLAFTPSRQQNETKDNKKCVAICDQEQTSSRILNQCISQEECSKSFMLKESLNSEIQMRELAIYSQDYLLLIYDSFFNLVVRDTGAFERSVSYRNDTVKIQIFEDHLFEFISNIDTQSISTWDILYDTRIPISIIKKGKITINSEIIKIGDKLACVTSYSLELKQMYITPIFSVQQGQLNQINAEVKSITLDTSSQKIKFISKQNIIIQTIGRQIQIKLIEINDSVDLVNSEMIKLTNLMKEEYLFCDGIQQQEFGQIIDSQRINSNQYLIIFNQLPNFILINIKENQCLNISITPSNPIKIQVFSFQQGNQKFYTAVQSQQKIDFFSEQLSNVYSYPNSDIIDFIVISDSNNSQKVYLLKKTKEVEIHQIITTPQNSFSLKKLGVIPINIQTPTKFFTDNQSKYTKLKKFNTLFVVNYDCQAINQELNESLFIIKSFETNYASNQSPITSIQHTTDQKHLVSSSSDGKILIWLIKNRFEGSLEYIFQNQTTESCFDIQIFQDKYIIAQYNTYFISIDIFNPYSQTKINFNHGLPTKSILIYKNQIILIQGNCLVIFNQKFEVLIQNCSDTISNAIKIIHTNDDSLIFIQTETCLKLIKIILDLQNQSVSIPYEYISNAKISFSVMRVYTNDSYEFAFIDSNFLFVVLNSQLKVINQVQIDTIVFSFDINYPINSDERIYTLLALNKDTTIQFRFFIYSIELIDQQQQGGTISAVYTLPYAEQTLLVYTYKNSKGKRIITAYALLPLSHNTYFAPFSYNQSTNEQFFQSLMLSPDQMSTKGKINFSLLFKNCFIGTDRGLVSYIPLTESIQKQVFPKTNGNDVISDIYQSFHQGVYSILSQSTVSLFNIHTDQREDVIQFSGQQNVSMQNSEALRISLYFTSTEIAVRNHFSKKTIKKSKLGVIVGAYIDEQTQIIYIYGDKLVAYELSLTQKVLVNNQNVQLCIFSSDQAFCKVNDNYLESYSLTTYNTIFSIQVTGIQNNFKLAIDLQYRNIFIYNQTVQVFTFQGVFVNILTQPTLNIMEFNFYGEKIVLFTTGEIYIYFRDTVQIASTIISPGSGFLTKIIYVKKYNQIAFAGRLIVFGQIFVYSLTTLKDVAQIRSTSKFNKDQSEVIDMFYDEEMNLISFGDALGQINNMNFSGVYDNDNSLTMIDFFSDNRLQFYKVDYNSNSILLGNSTHLYRVNYNLLCHQFQSFYSEETKKSVIITKEKTNYHFIIDKANILFRYSDYTQQYVTSFTENVLDIQLISSKDLLIIAFSKSIYVFEQNLLIQNQKSNINIKKIVEGYFYKSYICEEIFLTFNQTLIHYDFSQDKELSKYEFERSDDFIISQLWLSENNILILGMFRGQILIYNKSAKQMKPITDDITLNSYISSLIYFSDNIVIGFLKNGNIIQLKDYLNYSLTSINLIKVSYEEDQDEFDISNALFDKIYSRFYVWMHQQQKLIIIDSNNFQIINFISFPNNEINKIVMGNNILILYSSFQLNIYARYTLEFLQKIRRNSRFDKITDIILIQDYCLIIGFLKKLEVFLLDQSKNTNQMIDQIITQYPKISSAEITSQNSSPRLHLIGYSQNIIFDKIYTLNISIKHLNQCSATLKAYSSLQASQQFEISYQKDIGMKYSFFLQIESSLDVVKKIDQSVAQLVISPLLDKTDSQTSPSNQFGTINLNSQSFLSIQKNLILQNFYFKFLQKGIYQTNYSSKDIIFDNIKISSQNIDGIKFFLNKKEKIVLNSLELIGATSKRQIRNLQTGQNNKQYQSLFKIEESIEVSIYDLVIDNIQLDEFQTIFDISNVQTLVIKRLTVKNSRFSNLFQLQQIDSLTIEDIDILDNFGNNIIIQNDNNVFDLNQQRYLFEILGVQQTKLNKLSFLNNNNVYFIQSASVYITENKQITLNDDTINASFLIAQNNKFNNKILKDGQIIESSSVIISSMFDFRNSQILIRTSEITSNQSNFKFHSNSLVTLDTCQFYYNNAINGGGVIFEMIKDQLTIKNNTFTKNKAEESGGAIFINGAKNVIIDDFTKIIQNEALIGGGVRYINMKDSQLKIPQDFQIKENKASIYGKNIVNYPQKIQVQIDFDDGDNKIKQEFEFQKNKKDQSSTMYLPNVQSGGALNVTVKFIDNENSLVSLTPQKIRDGSYSKSIIEDIKNLNYWIETGGDQVQLSDESLVNYNSYDSLEQAFVKKNLFISATPDSVKILNFKYQTNREDLEINAFQLSVSFRHCKRGEILKRISQSIIQCYKCSNGFYSLQNFDNKDEDLSNMNFEETMCTKCPSSALSCEGSSISVRNGYWRKDSNSDEIYPCSNRPELCIPEEEENKFGCLRGNIGPLCESCDYSGRIWNNIRYSVSVNQNACAECSEFRLQIFYTISTIIILSCYLFYSLLMFMNNYSLEQKSYYLRQMHILPLSVSSIKDKSNFYMKILVNYIQLSSILLIKFQISFLPQLFAKAPSVLGQAVSQITINTLCIFSSETIDEFGEGRLKQITQSLIPVIFTFILMLVVFILKKIKVLGVTSYHKYTLANFLFIFFQPDSLNLFTRSLTCRQIGKTFYYSQDLLYLCDDNQIQKFITYFTIPNLLFWIIAPLVPLYSLYRNRKKLNYCKTKFRFGYFYSEFQSCYFYWEFLRIYLKVLIVIIFTLSAENEPSTVLAANTIIALYIIQIIIKKPFISYKLKKLEISSFLVLICQMILQTLITKYHLMVFEVLFILINYSFIIYMICIIINEKKSDPSNIIRKILSYLFFKFSYFSYFERLSKTTKQTNIKSLMRWKKISNNIKLIRSNFKYSDNYQNSESNLVAEKVKIQEKDLASLKEQINYIISCSGQNSDVEKGQFVKMNEQSDALLQKLFRNFLDSQKKNNDKQQLEQQGKNTLQVNEVKLIHSSNSIFKQEILEDTQLIFSSNRILSEDKQRQSISSNRGEMKQNFLDVNFSPKYQDSDCYFKKQKKINDDDIDAVDCNSNQDEAVVQYKNLDKLQSITKFELFSDKNKKSQISLIKFE